MSVARQLAALSESSTVARPAEAASIKRPRRRNENELRLGQLYDTPNVSTRLGMHRFVQVTLHCEKNR